MSSRDLLESDALRAFAVFAEHENFTAAAAALHLSQPSLHAKIGKLSASLGLQLYERHGRGLRLTPDGRRLAAFAQDCGRRVDDLLAELGSRAAPAVVAAGRGAFRWVIGDGVQRLARSGRPVRVVTANRAQSLEAVAGGQVDVAVFAHDPPPRPLEHEHLAEYRQTLVVPRRHRLARATEVTVADLEGLRLVMPPAERAHRRALDLALAQAGVRYEVAAEVDGWDLLVHFASLGLGATVVNGCVRPPAGLVAVPFADLPSVHYWACWRPQRADLAADLVAQLRPDPEPPA